MKWKDVEHHTDAFSLKELLVILGVIALLVCIILPVLVKARLRSRAICCNCNLKQIGLSFRQWSMDHGDKNPMQVSVTNGGTMELDESGIVYTHFQVMSNELNTPKTLICPADVRVPATSFGARLSNTNLSYFVGIDASDSMPAMFLSGDCNITNGPLPPNRILELTPNRPAGWTPERHLRQGNILFGDNSIQGLSDRALRQMGSGGLTNRLAIP
jgi:competence protein ComGC